MILSVRVGGWVGGWLAELEIRLARPILALVWAYGPRLAKSARPLTTTFYITQSSSRAWAYAPLFSSTNQLRRHQNKGLDSIPATGHSINFLGSKDPLEPASVIHSVSK